MKPNQTRLIHNTSAITRDIGAMAMKTGNLYESISIIGKRANQLSVRMKEELSNKLADFASTVDNLEEVFENKEQIEISKYYERLPKPSLMATDEFMEDRLVYRKRFDDQSDDFSLDMED